MKILTPEQFIGVTKVMPLKFEAVMYKTKLDIAIMVINLFMQSWSNHKLPGTNNAWRPRKNPKLTHPLLYKTGELYRGFNFELNELGVTVRNNVFYAKFHNDPDGSWGHNIQRQFLGTSNYIERQIYNRLLMGIRIASEL
ncbi:MAG: hypothetical protein ACRDD8_15525 [Bacteroidales bacterium]